MPAPAPGRPRGGGARASFFCFGRYSFFHRLKVFFSTKVFKQARSFACGREDFLRFRLTGNNGFARQNGNFFSAAPQTHIGKFGGQKHVPDIFGELLDDSVFERVKLITTSARSVSNINRVFNKIRQNFQSRLTRFGVPETFALPDESCLFCCAATTLSINGAIPRSF